jgi:hypothetical protein
MDSKEKQRLWKQKSRLKLNKGTRPCCICGSVDGPDLHLLKNIGSANFELLCSLNARTLPLTGSACCAHFEPHTGKPTKSKPLVVRAEFSTPFFVSPSTRKPPPSREPLLPTEKPKERSLSPELLPTEEPTKPSHELELSNRVNELEALIEHLELEKKNLQKEVMSFEDALGDLQSEFTSSEQENKDSWNKIKLELEEEKMKKKNREKDGRFLSLIGPPYIQSRLWLGIKDPEALFSQWQSYATTKWDQTFVFCTFLCWMRRGYPFYFLEEMLGKSEISFRRQFYKLLEDLEPWAKKQIVWPSLEDWKAKHKGKLKDNYPGHLFFWVDGTVIKTFAPQDSKSARVLYNAKHGSHSFVFFVAVSPDGEISYVSEVLSGTEHDKTHWNESTAPDEMQCYSVGEDFIFTVGGDKAYKGMRRPPHWANIITMTGEAVDEEDEARERIETEKRGGKKEWWQQNYTCDSKIARYRAVVERTIGAIKKWLVLANEGLMSKSPYVRIQRLVLLCCALTNWQLRNNSSGTW